MSMSFFLPINPPTATHQEKQVRVVRGKPVFYEPQALKNARQKLTAQLGAHAPVQPAEGPVRLVVKWCFPVTAGHRDGEYKTTRPDTDNLQKLLKDVMTRLGYWRDDALVTSEVVEKFWADRPGIYIAIEELEV